MKEDEEEVLEEIDQEEDKVAQRNPTMVRAILDIISL